MARTAKETLPMYLWDGQKQSLILKQLYDYIAQLSDYLNKFRKKILTSSYCRWKQAQYMVQNSITVKSTIVSGTKT